MRIIIDTGHPADFLLFKNFAHSMNRKGHVVLFTIRDKDVLTDLIVHEGFDYVNFGKHYKTIQGKIYGLVKFVLKLVSVSLKFKPDVFLSHNSIYSAFASFFLRKPNIALEDTGNWEQVGLSLLFTSVILTSSSFKIKYGKKQIYYEGYHELAYLYPGNFTPDKSILKEMGLTGNELFFILRFVSWDASHDIGHKGITLEGQRNIVSELSKFGKVFISSESQLSPDLEKYRFKLPPSRVHHAIAFSSLLFGESATMASEAAVLGVPAIYVAKKPTFYTKELEEKYGLVFNFPNTGESFQLALQKAIGILSQANFRIIWKEKQSKMLSEKIDVTSFLIWFVENWPKSFSIMKNTPEEQFRFRYLTHPANQ